MALLKDNSVIHTAANADLTAFTYTQVYCGVAGTPTINDVAVPMVAGTVLDLRVKNITGTAGIFVIGSPINTITGSQVL